MYVCIGKGRKARKRGKNKCKWTQEERKLVLWECFVRSGRKATRGYIKKVKACEIKKV